MKYTELQQILIKKLGRNITQAEIAEVLHLERSSISMRIKRDSDVTEPHKCRLEDYFGFKINDVEQNSNEDEIKNLPVRGDISASLGFGSFVNCETVTEKFPLPLSLMKKIGASPEHSCIINTTGESMYPTIIGGQDLIMIDESKKEVFDGKIYLIRMENSLFAKRLQKLPQNRLKVISDNPEYESYIVDLKDESLDFAIIGRVMWICRIL